MRRILLGIVAAFALVSAPPAHAQRVTEQGGTGANNPTTVALAQAAGAGLAAGKAIYIVNDAASATDCLVGLGSTVNLCVPNGVGGLVTQGGGGGGGGSSIILDLADDASNESIALGEIATTGDTNSIFTEPTADKLLIAVGQNWPTADTAQGLACTTCVSTGELDFDTATEAELTTHAGVPGAHHTAFVPDPDPSVDHGSYVPGGAGTDVSAVHDDVSGEIAVVTEKLTPIAGDFLLIEDSADTNAKKRIQIGNLPAGGGEINTHSSPEAGLSVAHSVPKSGSDLQLVSLAGVDFDSTADLITIDATIARDSELHAAATVSGTPDYITLSGQDIVRGLVDLGLAADVTGLLPIANMHGDNALDSELHAAATVSGTPDYITLSGQDIVRGVVDMSDDTNRTATLPLAWTGDDVACAAAVADGATKGCAAYNATRFSAAAGVVDIASVAGLTGANEDDVTLADIQAVSVGLDGAGGTFPADALDAMGEIAAAIKTNDTSSKLVTMDVAIPAGGNECLEMDNVGNIQLTGGVCTTGGGGDAVTINAVAVTNVDFNNTTPTVPANSVNVLWAKDGSSPANVSASIPFASVNHDLLLNYVAADHVDWAAAGPAGTVHVDNYIEGGAGTDTTAIHDDTASEISVVTLKATPVSGDFILIEDSAAANVKKRITVGSLPAGAEVNDLTAAVTWQNVPDANVAGVDERDEVCGTTDLSASCEINADIVGFADWLYITSLTGDVGLLVDECTPGTTPTGGGFVCEGSIADTNEQFYQFPDVNDADAAAFIVIENNKQVTDLEGAGLSVTTGVLNADHDAANNFLSAEHVDWAAAGPAGTVHVDNYIEGGAGTDTTAIHDDTASEISVVTLKATPVSGDFILIEDSAAANIKKRITVGSLPAGAETNTLTTAMTGVADDQVVVGTVAGGVGAYLTLPDTNTAGDGFIGYDTGTNALAARAVTLSGADVIGDLGNGNITDALVADTYSSTAADPADSGVVRLGNAECINWEQFPPHATDIGICLDANERFQVGAAIEAACDPTTGGGNCGIEMIEDAADGAAPAANSWRLYAKSGGLYIQDDVPTVYGPIGTSTGDVSAVGDCGGADCFTATGTGNDITFEGGTVDAFDIILRGDTGSSTTSILLLPVDVDATLSVEGHTHVETDVSNLGTGGYYVDANGADTVAGPITFTSETTIDDLGLEFVPGDTITNCANFSATGGGIFFDDSEGIFKKCEDNFLSNLDTTGAGVWTNTADQVHLVTTTDSVHVGDATPPTAAKFAVTGDADERQLVVTGFTTQTDPPVMIQGGADVANSTLFELRGPDRITPAIGDTVTMSISAEDGSAAYTPMVRMDSSWNTLTAGDEDAIFELFVAENGNLNNPQLTIQQNEYTTIKFQTDTGDSVFQFDDFFGTTFNETGHASFDFRHETDTLPYAMFLDSGKQTFNFLASSNTSDSDRLFKIANTTRAISATNLSASVVQIVPSLSEFVGASTHPMIAGMNVEALTVTNDATAVTTDVATVRIAGAPTGITPTGRTAALLVDGGNTYLDGNVFLGTTMGQCDAATQKPIVSATGAWTCGVDADSGGTPTQILVADTNMTVADPAAGTITATVDATVQGVWNASGLVLFGGDATDGLQLPLQNAAATPTIAFGDGDSGFYEGADDSIKVSTAGAGYWGFTATEFGSATVGAPYMMQEVATSTNPTLVPSNQDPDTGLGTGAADKLTMVAGGAEALTLIEGVQVTGLSVGDTVAYLPDVVTAPTAGPATGVYIFANAGSLWSVDVGGTPVDLAAGGAPGADSIGTSELDDVANTPVAGYAVVVETGATAFAYSDLSAVYEPLGTFSGVGTCTNQFARVLNDGTGPTCATVDLSADTNATDGAGILFTGDSIAMATGEASAIASGTIAPAADGALVIDTDGDGTNILNDTLAFQSGGAGEDYFIAAAREYPTVSNSCLVLNTTNNDLEWSATSCTAAGSGEWTRAANLLQMNSPVGDAVSIGGTANLGKLTVDLDNVGEKGIVISGFAAQTANFIELEDDAGTTDYFTVDADGDIAGRTFVGADLSGVTGGNYFQLLDNTTTSSAGAADTMRIYDTDTTAVDDWCWQVDGTNRLCLANGTAPTISLANTTGLHVSSDRIFHDTNENAVKNAGERWIDESDTKCITIEELAAADDNMLFWSPGAGVTLTNAWCHCSGVCTTEADLTLETVQVGTATPTVDAVTGTITCEDFIVGDAKTALSGTGATVAALDVVRFDTAASPVFTTGDTYQLCVEYEEN